VFSENIREMDDQVQPTKDSQGTHTWSELGLTSNVSTITIANMLLLDYQNVLIESLLKDRFSG